MPGGWTIALDRILLHELVSSIRNETQQEEHETIDEITVYHTRWSYVDVLLGERRQIAHKCALMEERRERHGGGGVLPSSARLLSALANNSFVPRLRLTLGPLYSRTRTHRAFLSKYVISIRRDGYTIRRCCARGTFWEGGEPPHGRHLPTSVFPRKRLRERGRSSSLKERQHGAEPQDDGRDHRSRLRLQHLPEQRELQYVASDLCTYMSCCSLARKLTRVLVFASEQRTRSSCAVCTASRRSSSSVRCC